MQFAQKADISPPKKVYIGSRSRVRTQTQAQKLMDVDSEFNSIHFGIEIKKRLKMFTPISFWV